MAQILEYYPSASLFPTIINPFSLDKCLCEIRTTTRRLVSTSLLKDKMTTTSISFGPPSTTEIHLGILPCRLFTGYNLHFFPSLSWSLTVLAPQPISPDSEATDYDSVLGSGPPVRSALASSSEQKYLSSPVSNNVRASSRLSISTSGENGRRPRLCSSRGAQRWSRGSNTKPASEV